MASLKSVAALILTLSVLTPYTHSTRQSEDSRVLPIPRFHIEGFSTYNTTYQIVTCNGLVAAKDIICELVVLNNNFVNVTERHPECSKFLVKASENFTIESELRVFPVSDNKTLVIFGETHTVENKIQLRFYWSHWQNCVTESSELEISGGIESVHEVLESIIVIVNLDGSYEIQFEDANYCKDVCELRFSSTGYLEVGPIDSLFEQRRYGHFVHKARPTQHELMNHDYCFVLSSEEQLNATLFFKKGVEDIIRYGSFRSRRHRFSTADGRLSICEQETPNSRTLSCSHGDPWTKFGLEFDYEVKDFLIHNHPDGGVLTVTIPTPSSHQESKGKRIEEIDLYLTKFDASYRKNLPPIIVKQKCFNGIKFLHAQFYQRELGEQCATFTSQTNNLTLNRACFPV